MNPLGINHFCIGTIDIRILEETTEKHVSRAITSRIWRHINSDTISGIEVVLSGFFEEKFYLNNS